MTDDGGAWSAPASIDSASDGGLVAVSCPSYTFCGTVDESGDDLSYAATPVAAPVVTANPTLSGSAVQGQTLTETNGSWANGPGGYTYQWEDCDSSGASCSPIAGATAQTYTLAASDVGHTIRVQETASNEAGAGAPAATSPSALVTRAPSSGGGGGGSGGGSPTSGGGTPGSPSKKVFWKSFTGLLG